MEVVPLPSAEDAGGLAADLVEELVARVPGAVLGLATGSSPLPTYRELVRRRAAGQGPSYAATRAFLLDEYLGLPPGHPQSYRATIHRELTDALGIPRQQVFAPDVDEAGLATAGRRYEEDLVRAGGIDLQVLGIGTDGHLAFNEPGSSLTSTTRIKTLTARTRHDNARFFGAIDEVPRHVLTQGLGTIGRAGHLVLLAHGEEKAVAVAAAVEGPLTSSCPGSIVQLHPHATVLVDEAAASQLERLEYYLEVQAARPDWQPR